MANHDAQRWTKAELRAAELLEERAPATSEVVARLVRAYRAKEQLVDGSPGIPWRTGAELRAAARPISADRQTTRVQSDRQRQIVAVAHSQMDRIHDALVVAIERGEVDE